MSCEVFLGGLPKATTKLAAVEMSLHAALLRFAGTSDPAAVRLRMHTASANGQGLGFAFAWLPDEDTARRLVEATELFFELDGEQKRAGTRAARGGQSRAAPTSQPGQQRVSVAVCASFDDSARVTAGLDAWRRCLYEFGIGLEVQLVDLAQLDRTHCDLVVLMWRRGALSAADGQAWARRAQGLGAAGRAVLVVEAEADDVDGDDAASPSPPPPDDHAPDLSSELAAAAAREAASGGGGRVDVVSAARLRALYPRGPRAGALACLAVRRAVACHLAPRLKVFVSDCDGTLWGGAVADEGAAGVAFGAAHLALQRALAELQRSGRLVCLASKNDEADVLEVFAARAAEMAISQPQLTAWQVHWRPKAASLCALSAQVARPPWNRALLPPPSPMPRPPPPPLYTAPVFSG